jgi:AP-3 complex subunit beta
LSAVADDVIPIDSALPDWLEHGVEPSLRDSDEDMMPNTVTSTSSPHGQRPITPVAASRPPTDSKIGASKGGWTNLDDFYADKTEESIASESEKEAVEGNMELESVESGTDEVDSESSG